MIKKFLADNIISSVGVLFVGGLNWLFNFLVLKYVSPPDVSSYNAFLGLFQIFSFPVVWISLMTINMGHNFKDRIKVTFEKHKTIIIVITIFATFVLLLLSLISRLSIYSYILLILLTSIFLLTAYYKGLIQNKMLFKEVAILSTAEMLLRVTILLSLIGLEFKSIAAFAGITIPHVILLIVYYLYSRKLEKTAEKVDFKKIGILTFAYGFNFVFFTSIDLVFARIFLDIQANKDYIAITQISKLLFYGSTALTSVLLPSALKTKHVRTLFYYICITQAFIIMGAVVLAGLIFFKYTDIVKIFEIVNASKEQMLLLTLYSCFYSLSQVPLIILLSKEIKFITIIILEMTFIQTLLYLFFGKDLSAFVNIYGIVSILYVLFSTATLAYYSKHLFKFQSIWKTR
jgi:hypothetical protein